MSADLTPADGVQTPAPREGRRTLKVTWHPNAVSGAVERAAELTSTSDPDGVCQVHWMDLACLLDLARVALAEPGEVEQAVMEEALRWRKIVEQWERGHQNEVLPYTAKLEAEVERLQRELDGVAVGSTASAGAPVSPVQTTDHADSRVPPVTDDMVEAAARGIARPAGWPTGGTPDAERVRQAYREDARRALLAAVEHGWRGGRHV